jgi:hypothetical protein
MQMLRPYDTYMLYDYFGGMREWPIRAVSKTAVRVTAPWVRIPLPPPLIVAGRLG